MTRRRIAQTILAIVALAGAAYIVVMAVLEPLRVALVAVVVAVFIGVIWAVLELAVDE